MSYRHSFTQTAIFYNNSLLLRQHSYSCTLGDFSHQHSTRARAFTKIRVLAKKVFLHMIIFLKKNCIYIKKTLEIGFNKVYYTVRYSGIVQSVEQRTVNPYVPGSSPVARATNSVAKSLILRRFSLLTLLDLDTPQST